MTYDRENVAGNATRQGSPIRRTKKMLARVNKGTDTVKLEQALRDLTERIPPHVVGMKSAVSEALNLMG